MFLIWRDLFPNSLIKEQRLLDQKRVILTRGLISPLELDRIKKSVVPSSEDQSGANQSVLSTHSDSEVSTSVMCDVPQLPIELFSSTDEQLNFPPLSEDEQELLDEITASMSQFTDIQNRTRLKYIRNKFEARKLTSMANGILARIPTTNICETNALIYSVAHVITNKLSGQRLPPPGTTASTIHSNSLPPWKARLLRHIQQLRREVNQLVSALNNNNMTNLQYAVLRKYCVEQRGLSVAV